MGVQYGKWKPDARMGVCLTAQVPPSDSVHRKNPDRTAVMKPRLTASFLEQVE